MSLRNLSIAPRAALGFGLVALLVLLLGAFSLLQMSEMRKQSEAVDQDWLPSVMALGEVSQNILRLRAVTLRLLLSREPDELQRNLRLADELRTELSAADSSNQKLISGSGSVAFTRFFAEPKRPTCRSRARSSPSFAKVTSTMPLP